MATLSTRELLKQLELRPSKKLGQNFLTDKNLAKKIVEFAELSENEHVVEVGPGLGALTEMMLEAGISLSVVEKDYRLFEYLQERYLDKLSSMHNCDVLDFTLDTKCKIVSNLPYVISSPFCFWLAAQKPNVSSAYVLFQKEFTDRLLASAGTKDYGALTVMVWYYFDIEAGFSVPGEAFVPKASIESRMVKLLPKEESSSDEGEKLRELVQTCFQKRRKQIGSVLSAKYGSDLIRMLEELGYSSKSRPEEVLPEHFLALARAVNKTS